VASALISSAVLSTPSAQKSQLRVLETAAEIVVLSVQTAARGRSIPSNLRHYPLVLVATNYAAVISFTGRRRGQTSLETT